MASSAQKTRITIAGGSSAPARGKARKGGKQGSSASASAQKKPGRGMGVAQLERMRVQENWKLLADLNPVQTGFGVQVTAPIRCAEFHALNAGLYPQALVPAAPAHYFTARPGSSYCGPGDRARAVCGLNGGCFRPELSSIPNPHHVDSGSWADFDFNSFSFKKKRVVNGEDLEGFVGGTRQDKSYYQGAEILAVHRKGVGRRNMVMEYGFFPANSGSSSREAGDSASSSASTAELYAASSYPYANSIDLSLRL